MPPNTTFSRRYDMIRQLAGSFIDLDLAPKSRNLSGPIDWERHHGNYADDRPLDPTGRYVAPKESER